ncbi:MAG: glycosyltransferase family 4 protein [Candidatus Melainabacteria bacterium]|nr:glycosyltransferase family 4 protein [Candidatus Melainabacteria bacterium]
MPLKNKSFKLLALASHPIQYQAPFFKAIAKSDEIDLTVLFYSRWGLESYYDEGFKKEFKWDIPLLEGYDYKFLRNCSFKSNPSKFFGSINFEVLDYLNSQVYDAVWVHGWNSFTNWLVFMSTNLKHLPIMLRCETNLLNPIQPVKAKLKKAILKNLFKRVSSFLPVGRYNAEFYKTYGVSDERMFLVPYVVDNDFFFTNEKKYVAKGSTIKHSYKIPDKLPVILFSGKLTDVKCPMDLLKAFAVVSNKQQAVLIYVGDGPMLAKMQKYVRKHKLKNVFFMGFKNQTELSEIYSIADIFVLPSKFEPWGLVVNEAMCFGKPVIVSDKVGAGGDLVKTGENGFVFEVGDISMLADCLEKLLSDEVKREEMGKRSLSIIRNWSFDIGIQGLLQSLYYIKKT